MSKKGQAAMEFLMTYGWAILSSLIMIAGISFFVFIDLDKDQPSICILPQGLSCLDSIYENGKFTFYMQNNLGKQILLEKVVADGCEVNRPFILLDNGASVSLTLDCIEFKGGIQLEYTNRLLGLEHKVSSEINVRGSNKEKTPFGATTDEEYCSNANNNGLCSMLDNFAESRGLGENYKGRCCLEWGLCCV